MDIKNEDFMKLPKYEEKSIVASVVAGFAAGIQQFKRASQGKIQYAASVGLEQLAVKVGEPLFNWNRRIFIRYPQQPSSPSFFIVVEMGV